MGEVKHLTDVHRRALEGGAWHGPALLEVLKGVTPKQAMARPIPDGHTIWEIVLHIEAWDRSVLGRLIGKPFMVTAEVNWPSIPDTSKAAWTRAIRSMVTTHKKLNRAIAKLAPAKMNRKYTPQSVNKLYHLVHGVVSHELYHAGQIAILKKA
jgi:uncharacterized damage-inducible protein DinB